MGNRNALVLTLLVAAILMVRNVPAPAQVEEEPASVVSDGTGTVYLAPTHLRFILQYESSSDNLKQALTAQSAQTLALREYLGAREMRPASLEVYPPRIDSMTGSQCSWTVDLRFSMAGLVGGEAGAIKLGGLCENIKAMGKALDCRVSDPEFEVAEKTVAIQDAVKEACRQAHTAAAGAAMALSAEIRQVSKVQVLHIAWNDPPNAPAQYPNIEVVSCTATVRVTYTAD